MGRRSSEECVGVDHNALPSFYHGNHQGNSVQVLVVVGLTMSWAPPFFTRLLRYVVILLCAAMTIPYHIPLILRVPHDFKSQLSLLSFFHHNQAVGPVFFILFLTEQQEPSARAIDSTVEHLSCRHPNSGFTLAGLYGFHPLRNSNSPGVDGNEHGSLTDSSGLP